MRTIIAGSRTVVDYITVLTAIREAREYGIRVTQVVSGTARGVDKLGEKYAEHMSLPVAYFPALWDKHGKKAGIIRNQEMADYAEACIAVWDGYSKGTKDMIERAWKANLKLYVYDISEKIRSTHHFLAR